MNVFFMQSLKISRKHSYINQMHREDFVFVKYMVDFMLVYIVK